jgi:type VI secretion system protein ImpF
MSGRNPRRGNDRTVDGTWSDGGRGEAARRGGPRAQLPLLDRLIDEEPEQERDPPMSSLDALAVLRMSVRRDLEALLNGRRRWLSWPSELSELASSAVGFGIPDFTSGALNDGVRRESLRQEVEASIRRFEPRMHSVRVSVIESDNKLEATLRLRIDGLLQVDQAREEVVFDTTVDSTTSDVYVVARE